MTKSITILEHNLFQESLASGLDEASYSDGREHVWVYVLLLEFGIEEGSSSNATLGIFAI
jgi:hypothetical protein